MLMKKIARVVFEALSTKRIFDCFVDSYLYIKTNGLIRTDGAQADIGIRLTVRIKYFSELIQMFQCLTIV